MKSLPNKFAYHKAFILLVLIGIGGLRLTEGFTFPVQYGRVFYKFGREFENKHKPDKALEYYRTALLYDPSLAEAYCQIGIVYRIKGEFDRSIEYLKKAIDLNPQFHQAYHALGVTCRVKHDYPMALIFFKRAYSLYPHYPFVAQYLYDTGLAYHDVGNEQELRHCIFDLRFMKEEKMAALLEDTVLSSPVPH